ncbi:MAG TPA: hypothetical protein VMP01_27125 [Pirellulaceae bacterium]|nr:hypothetical protein [Pirellulaceae bacterium]
MKMHKSVRLTPPDPKVDIDAEIAGLVKQCWRLGLITTHCCQGDADYQGQTGPGGGRLELAYVSFGDAVSALIFAAAAGPMAWSYETHRKRDRERSELAKRWSWDWHIDFGAYGAAVRFPSRDIQRAEASLRRYGGPLVRASERVQAGQEAHRSAPTCPTCGGLVISRRRDAKYCSRRCQLRARERGNKPAKQAKGRAVVHD